jgi:hypothetical protein
VARAVLAGQKAAQTGASKPAVTDPLRARRERPCRRATDERDELASPIKKTRSHGTIAKRVGLAKRPKPAKGLPFSSSRVCRQRPVRNSFNHLVGAGQQRWWDSEAERLSSRQIDDEIELGRLLHR